ncbi:alpha/beta hydrolase [Trujillonella endophytica]|uniref:Acetyl esterase/lipase n=1 Tax=Trujillonella endophytica TaxID=673521 RepID=A0A1H8RSY2_9ACTN|nr:alpha/beta hydrolase [Trujillella endophytica]SEO69729.1 Acetyl esterase/lipase [Trujillella endophytica]
MISEEALAVEEIYRERRRSPAPPAADLATQRADADRFGDETAEPTGVRFEPVDAGGVPAEWAVPDGAVAERVLIYFHGGGYGFCSIGSHRKLVGHLAKATGCVGLNVGYPLAPEHPHPGAVLAAVAAYRWILSRGHRPEAVVLAGDSAGGGLAAAALVKARDDGLPMPAAGILMSPWVDMALTGESMTTCVDTDLLSAPAGNRYCAQQFLAGGDPRDPYASPLYADLAGLPPLYIQVGDGELLLDDARRLAEKARAAGVEVHLDVFHRMQHDFQMFAGHMPEADAAVAAIGAFAAGRLG